MPVADGIVLVAPHPGQGLLLMNALDPAVLDEADPFSVDPGLDFMDPANGFRPLPESSSYTPDFVDRYRTGQRARVARLDDRARASIAERMAARKRGKETGARDDVARGAFQEIMTIWRTDGDLRCFDLSLDPSDRNYGSVWGRNPCGRIFRRQHDLSGGCRCAVRRHPGDGQVEGEISRRPSRPASGQGRGTGPGRRRRPYWRVAEGTVSNGVTDGPRQGRVAGMNRLGRKYR